MSYSIMANNKSTEDYDLMECGLVYHEAVKVLQEYIGNNEDDNWTFFIEGEDSDESNDSDDFWYFDSWLDIDDDEDDYDEPDSLTKFGMNERDFL